MDGRLTALFLLFFFSLPLGVQLLTNIVLILIALQALFTLKGIHWRQAFQQQTVAFSLLFFLVLLLSLFWSDDLQRANRLLETKQAFLLGPLLIMAARKRFLPGFREKALQAFVGGNVLAALIALGWAAFQGISQASAGRSVLHFFTQSRLADPIMHRGYFSTFLGLAFLIVFWNLWQGKSRRPGWAWASLALFMGMLLLTQGRMNIIALILSLTGLITVLAFRKNLYQTMLKLALILALMVSGLYTLEKTGYGRFSSILAFDFQEISKDRVEAAPARVAIWWGAWEAIKAAPFWGYGIGDAQAALNKRYQELGFDKALQHRHNAHNQFLEVLLQAGLLGLFLLVALFGAYLIPAFRQADLLALACLSFFLLCLLTESMLERAWGVILFNSLFPLLALGSGTKPRD